MNVQKILNKRILFSIWLPWISIFFSAITWHIFMRFNNITPEPAWYFWLYPIAFTIIFSVIDNISLNWLIGLSIFIVVATVVVSPLLFLSSSSPELVTKHISGHLIYSMFFSIFILVGPWIGYLLRSVVTKWYKSQN